MTSLREKFDAKHNVRKDGEIHLAPVNLDALTDDELLIAASHPALHEDVQMYAMRAYAARFMRVNGNIAAALRLEARNDLEYKTAIPKACRW